MGVRGLPAEFVTVGESIGKAENQGKTGKNPIRMLKKGHRGKSNRGPLLFCGGMVRAIPCRF